MIRIDLTIESARNINQYLMMVLNNINPDKAVAGVKECTNLLDELGKAVVQDTPDRIDPKQKKKRKEDINDY